MSRLKIAKPVIEPGTYRHFKGKLYEVQGLVRHSETLEEMVLYKALYKNRLGAWWVRPAAMFLEKVTHEGRQVPRFERISGSPAPDA